VVADGAACLVGVDSNWHSILKHITTTIYDRGLIVILNRNY